MKKYKGFMPKFYVDTEKGLIRGKVLNTRDTITFYGKTVAEAYGAFQESVDDYLAFCKEIGVEPEKPFNGNILVRITPELHRRLTFRAQNRGQSVNKLIEIELAHVLRRRALAQPKAPATPVPKKTLPPKKTPSRRASEPSAKKGKVRLS